MSFDNSTNLHEINSSTSSDDQSSVNSVIHVENAEIDAINGKCETQLQSLVRNFEIVTVLYHLS